MVIFFVFFCEQHGGRLFGGEILQLCLRNWRFCRTALLFKYPSPLAGMKTEQQAKQWLKSQAGFAFVKDQNDEIAGVRIDLRKKMCQQYVQKCSCQRANGMCRKWHICKSFIEGNCDGNCSHSHDFFDEDNKENTEERALEKHSNEIVRTIVAWSLPQVCLLYLRNECKADKCPYLHVCSNVVSGSSCTCPLLHSLTISHNKTVLKRYDLAPHLSMGVDFVRCSILIPNEQKCIGKSKLSSDGGAAIKVPTVTVPPPSQGTIKVQSKATTLAASSNISSSSKDNKTKRVSHGQPAAAVMKAGNPKKQQNKKRTKTSTHQSERATVMPANNLGNNSRSPCTKDSLECLNVPAEDKENLSDLSSDENSTVSISFRNIMLKKEGKTHSHQSSQDECQKIIQSSHSHSNTIISSPENIGNNLNILKDSCCASKEPLYRTEYTAETDVSAIPSGLTLKDASKRATKKWAPNLQTREFQKPLTQTGVFEAPLLESQVSQGLLSRDPVYQAILSQARISQALLSQTQLFQALLLQARVFEAPLSRPSQVSQELLSNQLSQTISTCTVPSVTSATVNPQVSQALLPVPQISLSEAHMYQDPLPQSQVSTALLSQAEVCKALPPQALSSLGLESPAMVSQSPLPETQQVSAASVSQREVSQVSLSQIQVSLTPLSQAKVSQAPLSPAQVSQTSVSQTVGSQIPLSQAQVPLTFLSQAHVSPKLVSFTDESHAPFSKSPSSPARSQVEVYQTPLSLPEVSGVLLSKVQVSPPLQAKVFQAPLSEAEGPCEPLPGAEQVSRGSLLQSAPQSQLSQPRMSHLLLSHSPVTQAQMSQSLVSQALPSQSLVLQASFSQGIVSQSALLSTRVHETTQSQSGLSKKPPGQSPIQAPISQILVYQSALLPNRVFQGPLSQFKESQVSPSKARLTQARFSHDQDWRKRLAAPLF